MPKVTVTLGPALFDFSSHVRWVNKARSWYANCGIRPSRILTLDAAGRVMRQGSDFSRAEREGTFPVTAYAIDEDAGE